HLLRALLRQARADLRTRPLESLQIVLIVAASTMTLTMGVAMFRSANVLWDRIFALSNGPHAVFMTRGSGADLAGIARLDGVVAVAEPFPVVRGARLAQDPRKLDLWLHGMNPDQPTVGRPLLVDGRWLG